MITYPDPRRFQKLGSNVMALDFNTFPSASLGLLDLLSRTVHPLGGNGYFAQVCTSFQPYLGKTYFGEWGTVDQESLSDIGIRRVNPIWKKWNKEVQVQDDFNNLMVLFSSAKNFSDIKNVKFKDAKIGYSVISTLATKYGDSSFTKNTLNRSLPRLVKRYLMSYYLVNELIKENCIDTVIIFNGRFVHESAAAAAALNNGVEVIYFERPRENTFIASRHSPHSIKGFGSELQEAIADDASEVAFIAKNWFEQRQSNNDPEISEFQNKWNDDPFDLNLGQSRGLISIFPTSDDEFFGISEDWDLPNSSTQFAWISKFGEIAASHGYKVVIRLHPNLLSKSRRLRRTWNSLKNIPGLEVIRADSPVNSYKLIQGSDLVVTCGSTIAMEAGYLGVPTLSIGSGIYDDLNAVQKITDPAVWDLILESGCFSELNADFYGCEKYGFLESRREIQRVYDTSFYPGSNSPLPNSFNRLISYVLRELQKKQFGVIHRINK